MPPPPSPVHRLTDVPCLGCGCLCDDIATTVQDARIVEAEHACPIGEAWFRADHGRRGRPAAKISGREATADEALARSAEILLAARSPLILGLTATSLEAQAAATAIADLLGAAIDPAGSSASLPRWRAVQRVGMVSATLGEVRNRADVVIFWGVDPVTTHPRHLERYSAGPPGRFVPEGRAGRTLVVVDGEPTPTSAVADRFVRVPPDEQGDVLATLRALVLGVEIPFADDPLRELAETMRTARYGAFFFGEGLGRPPGGSAAVEEALKLVRDLNASTRFVALTLGGAGNPSGAEAVLSWQAGAPVALDFSLGFPRFLPDEATAEARLLGGGADAALIVADDPAVFLGPDALAALANIPTIAIGPRAVDLAPEPTVAILSAVPGIHTGGTVLRCDGATLPLRPSLRTDLPHDLALLRDLERRCRRAGP